jgi:glycogen synthase kinase 3 beta
LKPENVLISDDEILKICDFGSSKILDQNGKNTPYIVSRYYRAPELILCVTNYTTAIDIWGIYL